MEVTANQRVKWTTASGAHARRRRARDRRVPRPHTHRPLPAACGLGGGEDPRAAPADRRARGRFRHAARAAREARARARRARVRPRLAGARRPARASRRTASSTATRSCSCSRAPTATSCASHTWWFPDRRPRAVQGLLRLRRGARGGSATSPPTASTPGSAPRRRSARSAGSTIRCCRRRCAPTRSSVANTVIHELTHNTFYAPGGAVFNESFANFVGARGAERVLPGARAARGRRARSTRRWEDEKLIGRFWASLYARVDSAFKAHPGDEPARVAARIAAARLDLSRGARVARCTTIGPQLRTIEARAARAHHDSTTPSLHGAPRLPHRSRAFDAVLTPAGWGPAAGRSSVIIDAAKADAEAAIRCPAGAGRDSVPR